MVHKSGFTLHFLQQGSVTSPAGFLAGGAYCGINTHPRFGLDLGLLYSVAPCVAAGTFTMNRFKSAAVLLCESRLPSHGIRAVVANSGCANTGTGEQGLVDAMTVATLAAAKLDVPVESVLIASTGVIGPRLDVARIASGLSQLSLEKDGGQGFSRAILTTDTVPKLAAIDCGRFIVGGVAKGSGMIHPQMGTMLGFLTTDAIVELAFMQQALREAVDRSFNMVSVDGDTSPNDTVLIMANGMASGPVISKDSADAELFCQALNEICVYLATAIARDGEGATRLVTVVTKGARNRKQARMAARSVVSSSLVKAAIHGGDPNWGRVVAALGRSGAEMDYSRLSLVISGVPIVKRGSVQVLSEAQRASIFSGSDVMIDIDLGLGPSSAIAWGCDLSEEYVTINSQYTT